MDTPIMPSTVSALSPMDPFLRALRMPRILPSTVEDDQRGQGELQGRGEELEQVSLMGTPLVME